MKPRKAVALFDSATGMLRTLARYLRGRDTPLVGQAPDWTEPALSAFLQGTNQLPRRAKETAYAAAGWREAISPERTGEIDANELAHWVVDHYPRRRYPAVFIGSSNGALVHAAAALGVPWLPQTLLVPVRRRGGHPDEPQGDLEAMRASGKALLDANPELALHHMHDPNQDRLMIAGMSYFRIKWLALPPAYRDFLRDWLVPGGTIVVADCTLSWPTTRVDDRYVFQHGALGGATAEEFQQGGPRVADLLARYGSPYRTWQAPPADSHSPEAEWGFAGELLADLTTFAKQDPGHRLAHLRFPHPESPSPAVADIYRDWYARRDIPTGRLLVENFLLLEPWLALRTGSVPYWAVFNTEPSRAALATYLDGVDPYDEIRLTLMSHGVDSIGLASIRDWEEVTSRARKVGTLLGVDRNHYPRDFATFARFHQELSRVRAHYPMPPSLELRDIEGYFDARSDITRTLY